jgi:dephospho-CoA kinase
LGKQPGKPVIGIVGGVGSGKSTVAKELARLGCAVIDADRIGHELLGAPDVREELHRRWGAGILDESGQVDRGALGRLVFADPDQLAALNGILHPRIRREAESRIASARACADVPAIVVDAALLLEAGWDDVCTHRVFVRSLPADRRSRVKQQRGWEEAEWARREKSQKGLDTKLRMCDYIVDNSSSLPHLVDQIRRLFGRIVSESGIP